MLIRGAQFSRPAIQIVEAQLQRRNPQRTRTVSYRLLQTVGGCGRELDPRIGQKRKRHMAGSAIIVGFIEVDPLMRPTKYML